MEKNLGCFRETGNAFNSFVVCVKDAKVVSHVPRKISSICSMFLQKTVLWINFCGSDTCHEIHEISYTTTCTVNVSYNMTVLLEYY